MRIAFDAKRALNNGTGLGNYARILLNALMRDYPDNDYLLFTPKVRDEYFHQLHGDFKLFFPETKFENAFKSLWRSYGLTAKVVRQRCHIFHGLSNELPFNIDGAGVKTVVTIHDLIFLKHTEQYPWIDRQFYEMKTRYACKHADKIIAVSNETKADLVNYYKVPEQNIEVVYQSVDESFTVEKTTDDKRRTTDKYNLPAKYILNVGSFYPRKNQVKLVEAFALIARQIEEDLVLIGSGNHTLPAIQELIASKGLTDRVHILATVSSSDLPAIYQSANLFVYPSLFEGFGIPVLEALYSKVPVIATKGGAIEEAAGKSSVFVNPNSAEDMADRILTVLKNDTLRSSMIGAGYKHALTMTDKTFAEQTMQIYNTLAG